MVKLIAFLIAVITFSVVSSNSLDELDTDIATSKTLSLHTLEGKVVTPPDVDVTPQWLAATRVIVNYGEFVGFLK